MRLMLWRHRQSLLKRKQVELKYRHTDFERYNMGESHRISEGLPSCGIKDMAKKIYLADDEQDIREILTEFLSNAGYEVTAYKNGDTLFSAFRGEAL